MCAYSSNNPNKEWKNISPLLTAREENGVITVITILLWQKETTVKKSCPWKAKTCAKLRSRQGHWLVEPLIAMLPTLANQGRGKNFCKLWNVVWTVVNGKIDKCMGSVEEGTAWRLLLPCCETRNILFFYSHRPTTSTMSATNVQFVPLRRQKSV